MIKARMPVVFNKVNQFEREFDFLIAEYGWTAAVANQLDYYQDSPVSFGNETCYITGIGYGTTGDNLVSLNLKINVGSTKLCDRWFLPSGERWWQIDDSHPYAKYLRAVLPSNSIWTGSGLPDE